MTTACEEAEACICDHGPNSDGPEEDCPQHGRPYSYWVERSDALSERLAAALALADKWIARDDLTKWGEHARGFCGRELRAALTQAPADASEGASGESA